MRHVLGALALLAATAPCLAQESDARIFEMQGPGRKALTPQCSGGVVYDSGTFTGAYSIGTGSPSGATMVMKFILPPGTTSLDQVCSCFSRADSGAPSSMSFEAVVYNDNGPGGGPGTFLGAVNATASAIPVTSPQFYSVDFTGSGLVLPDNVVYVGVRWQGGNIGLCGDAAATTTQQTSYGSADGGGTWNNTQLMFPSSPPRALGVRLDPTPNSTNCTPDSTTLCLNNGRFRVEATYNSVNTGQSGPAQVVKFTDDAGYLWFFNPNNVEVVVKVINACAFNQRYWVYSAGLTDVQVTLRVTDTQSGQTRIYPNAQGHPYQPNFDSSAFATCP